MKAKVDPNLCTGCELCPDIAPEVFRMQDDVAVAYVDVVPADAEDSAKEAAESCPVEAITVTDA
jgi:ferredoxin